MTTESERMEYVAELRGEGYTYAEIGDILGVSKQAAWLVLHPQGKISAERAAKLEALRAEWWLERETLESLDE